MKENHLLCIKGVKKSFDGKSILKGVNMTIDAGDIYGLLGTNGAGKTTILKLMLGLISADEGEFFYKGKDYKSIKKTSSIYGASIDEPVFYNNLSGIDNLRVYGALVGTKEERINQIMKDFDIYEQRNVLVKKYSQGMRQRLAIARVFLNDPEIVILDEPTNGLDPNGIKYMRELIRSLAEKYGKTVILSTHLLGEAMNVCTKVGIIRDGVIVVEDNIESICKGKGDDVSSFEDFFMKHTEESSYD